METKRSEEEYQELTNSMSDHRKLDLLRSEVANLRKEFEKHCNTYDPHRGAKTTSDVAEEVIKKMKESALYEHRY
jgi:hypothetical protein